MGTLYKIKKKCTFIKKEEKDIVMNENPKINKYLHKRYHFSVSLLCYFIHFQIINETTKRHAKKKWKQTIIIS